MAGLNNLPLNGAIINIEGVGAGLAQSTGLLSELQAQPHRVQFIKPGTGTVLVFDAVINETHSFASTPTMFPLEDGSVISDHIVQSPVTLSLTGIVSDTPLPDTMTGQLKQTFGAAATTLMPPLGVTLASTAYALYSTGTDALKPSKKAFQTLLALREGNASANPPTPPVPFTVITKYFRYESMIITNLTFPVDASTDGQLVFTVDLIKLTLVAPQIVNLQTLSNAALAAAKIDAGTQNGDTDDITAAFERNRTSTRSYINSTADRIVGVLK